MSETMEKVTVMEQPTVEQPTMEQPSTNGAAPAKEETSWTEEIEIAGSQLVERVKELIAEGNVRRLILRTQDDKLIMEIPLTAGAVFGGVVTLFFVQRRVDGQGSRGGQVQRVAVRFGAGHGFCADGATGATAVVDHDRLAEARGQLQPDGAGDGVGRSARSVRHHEGDGPLGIVGKGERRRQRECGEGAGKGKVVNP